MYATGSSSMGFHRNGFPPRADLPFDWAGHCPGDVLLYRRRVFSYAEYQTICTPFRNFCFDFLALLLVFSNGTLVFRPVRNDLDPFDGASGFMELEASPLPFPAAVSSGSLLYPQPLGGLASCWCLIYIGIRLEPPARRSAEQAAGDRFQHPESGRSRCISHPSFSSGAFPCSSFLSIV